MALYSIGYIARYYGVSPSTIRRWEASGKIPASIRTIGGHRRFEQTEDKQPAERKHVGYARVSSHDQRADLDRQIERLQNYGCDEICSDVGSGLNCAKPGLKRLLRDLLDHKIHTLTVTHGRPPASLRSRSCQVHLREGLNIVQDYGNQASRII